MFTRKQHAKKEMKEPNQLMSEKLLEFVSDGLQKTEQALFKLKFDLEKDLNSKLPQDLLLLVEEVCDQLPNLPPEKSREFGRRLEPLLQILNEIVNRLAPLNLNPPTSNHGSAKEAVKLYKKVQNTRKNS